MEILTAIGEVVGAAVGIAGVYFLFGRRIRKRWRLGADALRALARGKVRGLVHSR